MAERLQALSTAAITQYLAQYHQAQAAMAAFQQQHLSPTVQPQQQQQFPPSNLGQHNHPLQPNSTNLNFGAAGGLPTTVEELAFINNFLIKLGEQIASGEYYGAGIPPPTAAAAAAAAAAIPAPISMPAPPPPPPATPFANTIPYAAAALGAAGLGLGAAGLGAAAGGMYDPALLAHLGLSSGLGLHFPISATPQQQQQPSSFGGGGNPGAGTEYPVSSNDVAGSGSLYPSLFPQQQHHASSPSSASPSASPPLDASVLASGGVLGIGHSHLNSTASAHHHNLTQQRSPSGTPEFDFDDYEYSDVLSGTTAGSQTDGGPGSLGAGPPQKRTSSMSGSGSKRTRLASSSPTQRQQQQQYYEMVKQEQERRDSPTSSASARSLSLRHSHSPASVDQHDFTAEQQQQQQQERQAYYNNGVDLSHLLTPTYGGNANLNAAMLTAFGIGGVGAVGGAGISDAAKRAHIPHMGTYQIGSAQPVVHAMPKVQTSTSASNALPPKINLVKTEEKEEADDVDDDGDDDYIRPTYRTSSGNRDVDSDGEPTVGRLRRIRVPPVHASTTPSPIDHSPSHIEVSRPSMSLSVPSSSPPSSRPSHSRSSSASSSSFSPGPSSGIIPLPLYPTLDASLKLPALRNVAGATDGGSGHVRARRTSKGSSISSLASISSTSSMSSRSTVSPGVTPRVGSTRSLPAQYDADGGEEIHEDESDRSDRGDGQEMRDATQERDRERVTLPGVSSILAAAAAGREVSSVGHGHMEHIMGDLRGIALRSAPTTPRLAASSSPDPRSPKPPASKIPSSSSKTTADQRVAHAELIGRLLVFINAEFAKRNPSPSADKSDTTSGRTGAKRATRAAKLRITRTHSPVSSEDENEDEDAVDGSASHHGGPRSVGSLRRTTPSSSSSTATRTTYRSSCSRISRGDEDENEEDNSDHSHYSRSKGPKSLYPDLCAPIQTHRQVYAQ